MLRAALLLVVILVAGPALAQQYQSKELADAAGQWRQQLIDSVPQSARQPGRIAQWRHDADTDIAGKNYALAIGELSRAIASGADDGLTWLRLAQSQYAVEADQVLASAYMAYSKSTDPVERGAALFIIGRDYDRHMKQKEALQAFQAGLALARMPAVAERVEQLKRLVAFRVTKVGIEADAAAARTCLIFNEKIGTKGDISYGAYVRTEPAVDSVVTVRGETLCLDGIQHGQTYQLQILAGLPAETGEKMAETFSTRIVVPDRKKSISFSGTGYVLPRQGSAGLPVTTVNVDKVKIKLLRVNERNLVPSLDAERLTMSFSGYEIDEVMNRTGSLVWQGEMAVKGERNRAVATAIPLNDMLKEKGPGVYLVAVSRADAAPDDDTAPATNWVLVSDLGLTSYTGTDGMAVDVRSLATGKPLAGVEIRLYAHNNGELARATSDADGIVRFAGGLLHGHGGDAPFALMAYGAEHDFNFLEIGRAAFDLSDRGVSGRPSPGPVDAFLYTDRGIYRPGETVQLMTLVRDDKADAAPGLPLTLRLLRPDGVEVDNRPVAADKPGATLGAYYRSYALPRDARIGAWRVELRLDPKAPPIGTAEFQVEDFVPPQLKVALSAADQPIVPSEEFPVAIDAHYYYGAPGAGLATEARASIALDDNPFPDQPGYQFGLVDETYAGDRRDLDAPTIEDDGTASLAVSLGDLPDLTRPLAATISVGVFEPSGRPVTATLTRPIRSRPLAIGLRSSAGDEAIAEGQPATLDIIALDAAGKPVAAPGLRWELIREDWQYDWYAENGVWRYRRQVRDRPLETGTVDVAATAPAALSRTVPAGRYRWEVSDGTSGAASSLRFHVGWWVEAELPDVPDKLTATLDKPHYAIGDTAKLFIKAPFAGSAELVIASNKIMSLRALNLPAEGTTIDIPVDAAWGSGVYALVSAYRPAGAGPAVPDVPVAAGTPPVLGPGRAVGVAWLGIDASARTLTVTMTPPPVARPRQPVEIPVQVAGLAAGEEAYVTVAAVDEAVLSLTDFASPAPDAYYYGKRQLGVELRDLYGRLIDAHANAIGVLRSGGDSFAKRSVAGLPDKSSRVVALFSGLVRLDAAGAAKIRLDIPDFQGQLRLMAVAVAAHKVGSGHAKMIVRDPVVTTVSLPRFLAPGDAARLGVGINNLEGAAGDYHLTMTASGAGALAGSGDQVVHLATGASFNGAFNLDATTIGNVALKLSLTGPGGLQIVRDFTVGVRPGQAYQLKRFVGRLQPGESVTLDDSAAIGFLPGTAEALLTVSPRPDWDVPGLLRVLDRYAYGCIEQTTSRALPLLYVADVAKLWNTDPGFSPAATLDRAIGHIAEMQRSDGSFGVWSDSDDTVPWLDAYATDFLTRAREHGITVPDFVLTGALNWLRDYTRQSHKQIAELPAVAYAHYVLARAKQDDLGALRYFNDTEMTRLPTQLAKAQLGAALALYGDAGRAAAANAAALEPAGPRPPGLRYVDYGSELRDSAGVLAFVAANPGPKPSLTSEIDHIQALFSRADRTSTQEQAWLLMAAEAAASTGGGAMTIARGTNAPETLSKPVYLRRALGSGGAAQTIANRGTAPIWRTVSITGVDKADLPAESNGFAVTRTVYRPDGSPADLAKARQTDLFVVVLKATRADAARPVQSLVVDLLPAGFEIETTAVSKSDGAGGYSWLPDLSGTTYSEGRDDRYVAALDLAAGKKDLALAYVVRAVTPGTFKYPALVVEDMYDPETTGRTAIGRLVVTPR